MKALLILHKASWLVGRFVGCVASLNARKHVHACMLEHTLSCRGSRAYPGLLRCHADDGSELLPPRDIVLETELQGQILPDVSHVTNSLV